jgi:hypothetical protein
MGLLDRFFGRGRRRGEGNGGVAGTTPWTTQPGSDETQRDEEGSGESEVGPASQDIEVGDSGGGDGGDGGGDGGGGNGGGGGE